MGEYEVMTAKELLTQTELHQRERVFSDLTSCARVGLSQTKFDFILFVPLINELRELGYRVEVDYRNQSTQVHWGEGIPYLI